MPLSARPYPNGNRGSSGWNPRSGNCMPAIAQARKSRSSCNLPGGLYAGQDGLRDQHVFPQSILAAWKDGTCPQVFENQPNAGARRMVVENMPVADVADAFEDGLLPFLENAEPFQAVAELLPGFARGERVSRGMMADLPHYHFVS